MTYWCSGIVAGSTASASTRAGELLLVSPAALLGAPVQKVNNERRPDDQAQHRRQQNEVFDRHEDAPRAGAGSREAAS
jgi:hypothetical protein